MCPGPVPRGLLHLRLPADHVLGIDPPAQAQGAVPLDVLEGHPAAMERRNDYPEWEPGTGPEGWGDRVWIQKDMFDFTSYDKDDV